MTSSTRFTTTTNRTAAWKPLISPRQYRVVQGPPGKIYRLINGPRRSSKTMAVLNAVLWHLWNNAEDAMMLGKTIDQNLTGGAWQLLHDFVLPQWVRGEGNFDKLTVEKLSADGPLPEWMQHRAGRAMSVPFGFEVVTPVRMEAVTHRYFFECTNKALIEAGWESSDAGLSRAEIVNKYGVPPSRLYLDSLDNENNAENKFKGKAFGLIYWTEVSNFKGRHTFDVLCECFRVVGWPASRHLFILDTNPSDAGEDHWLWQLFYWFRTLDLDQRNEDIDGRLRLRELSEVERALHLDGLRALQQKLDLVEVTLDDNPFLTRAEKAAQRAAYAHNQDLFDRYYRGLWKKSSGEGFFAAVWKPTIHVIGDRPALFRDEPVEFMIPEPNCIELGGGVDIGHVNIGITFREKTPFYYEDGTIKVGFKLLDEIAIVGVPTKLEDLIGEWLEKMDFWEKIVGRKVNWTWWSDSSSFNRYSNISDNYEHREIYRLSGRRINLRAASRVQFRKGGAASVSPSIDLISRMLFEDRILVSASKCPKLIEMLGTIQKNKRGMLDRADKLKHILDALRYDLGEECFHEIAFGSSQPNTAVARGPSVFTTRL
jgi:hypothetical protein